MPAGCESRGVSLGMLVGCHRVRQRPHV